MIPQEPKYRVKKRIGLFLRNFSTEYFFVDQQIVTRVKNEIDNIEAVFADHLLRYRTLMKFKRIN